MYVKHGFGPIKLVVGRVFKYDRKRIRAVMLNETLKEQHLVYSDEGILELRLDDGSIRGIYSADIQFQTIM